MRDNGKHLVYLAGPLDYVMVNEPFLEWKKEAKVHLRNHVLFDPGPAFTNATKDKSGRVMRINLGAIAAASAVLALVDGPVASWGTPIEIMEAERLGKLIVLYTPKRRVPLYLRHLPAYESLIAACGHINDRIGEQMPVSQMLAYGGGVSTPKYTGDVGYDVHALQTCRLEPWKVHKVPVGTNAQLQVRLPAGTWCEFRVRSSYATRLQVLQTVIDTGYTGPLEVFTINLTGQEISILSGERFAQLVLHQNIVYPVQQVEGPDQLGETDRGSNRYGSSNGQGDNDADNTSEK